MSAEAGRALGRIEAPGRAEVATPVDRHIRQRMTNLREAFRLRRLARNQCRLYDFYDEHSMTDEARNCRRLMMHLLRSARTSWRRALGFVS